MCWSGMPVKCVSDGIWCCSLRFLDLLGEVGLWNRYHGVDDLEYLCGSVFVPSLFKGILLLTFHGCHASCCLQVVADIVGRPPLYALN